MQRAVALVLQAALLAGCCCGLPGGFTPPAPRRPILPTTPPRSSSAPVPAPPPGAVACGGGYQIRAGQTVSGTDPRLRDYLHPGQTLAVGFVGIELTRAGSERFPNCRVRFSVYRYRDGVRAIEIESERDLHATDDLYNKSWNLHEAGDWEIVVSDVQSNVPLASVRFMVRT